MQFPSPPPKGQQATFLTGLLFGLIFGASASLVEILYVFLFWHGAIPWLDLTASSLKTFHDFVFRHEILTPVCLALTLFSLCPVAGLLAARRTHQALSGTWAGLGAGAFFVLVSVLVNWRFNVFTLWDGYSTNFFILAHLLVLAVGTYLGFLGGLLGRKKLSVKNIVGVFYSISLAIFGASLLAGVYAWGNYSISAGDFPSIFDGDAVNVLWAIVLMQLLATISGLVATILTLIEFYRARAWTQFILTFFGGILTLVYLITGAQPAPAPQNSPLVLAPIPPGSVPVALTTIPVQPSALDILQQRLAKGEIDEMTYQRLAAVLEKQR